jgi:hypothetical protein
MLGDPELPNHATGNISSWHAIVCNNCMARDAVEIMGRCSMHEPDMIKKVRSKKKKKQ